MSNRGQLFVVSAPSGAGKTSLVNALVELDDQVVISVSYTTRDARPGELDGTHYHFISSGAFLDMHNEDQFLESAQVFGHSYGTLRATTDLILDDGKDVILEIDWQGAQQVRRNFPECHSIFILPPSLEALRSRLGNRGQDSQQVIDSRMDKAQAEISHCGEFTHILVNDDFDVALSMLHRVITGCRNGNPPPGDPHKELLAELLGKS